MRTFLLLGCFFIFKNSMAQTQPDISKYPVDPRYLSSFDGTKIFYKVPGEEGKPVLLPGLIGAADHVKKQGLNQRALAYLPKERPSTLKEELPNILQPVLIISCDKDSQNGSSGELTALLPHSSFATTPGDHNHATEQKNFRLKSYVI